MGEIANSQATSACDNKETDKSHLFLEFPLSSVLRIHRFCWKTENYDQARGYKTFITCSTWLSMKFVPAHKP